MVKEFSEFSNKAQSGSLNNSDVDKFFGSTGMDAGKVKSAISHMDVMKTLQSMPEFKKTSTAISVKFPLIQWKDYWVK